MVRIRLSGLTLHNDRRIDIPDSGVTVIVGPNNAGKSQLIREIFGRVSPETLGTSLWLSDISVDMIGNLHDVREWFDLHSGLPMPPHHMSGGEPRVLHPNSEGWQQSITFDELQNLWHMAPAGLGKFWPYFGALLGWSDRQRPLGASRKRPREPAREILHYLYDDPGKEREIAEISRKAFGFPVCIDHYSDSLQLLIGEPQDEDLPLRPSVADMTRFQGAVPVSSQGDGVVSFMGILLSILLGPSFILIDEPEAFLHPPQARLLGRLISDNSPRDGQIILATHSADLLEGILDTKTNREVKILRVSNASDGERALHELPSGQVADLWRDPLMRYSRVLDALFHRGAIVCEAEGDCRFYAACLDWMLRDGREHDLFFTHVGGKSRLSRALHDLRALSVPSMVIGDLDVLNDLNLLRELVNVAGGDYLAIEPELKRLHSSLRETLQAPTYGGLRKIVGDLIKGKASNMAVSEADARALSTSVKQKSRWHDVKKAGLMILEPDMHAVVIEILAQLRDWGIFLVPVGELERWFPEVTQAKPIYVTEVLEERKFENPTPQLHDFLKQISAFFGL